MTILTEWLLALFVLYSSIKLNGLLTFQVHHFLLKDLLSWFKPNFCIGVTNGQFEWVILFKP